jgi:hypothetical protein
MTCLAFPIEECWFGWLEREGRELVVGRSSAECYARYQQLFPLLQRAMLESLPQFPGFDFLDEVRGYEVPPQQNAEKEEQSDESDEEREDDDAGDDDDEEEEWDEGKEEIDEPVKTAKKRGRPSEGRSDAIVRYLRAAVAFVKEKNYRPDRVPGINKLPSKGRQFFIDEMMRQRVLSRAEGRLGYFVQSKRWPTLEDILLAIESGEIKVD